MANNLFNSLNGNNQQSGGQFSQIIAEAKKMRQSMTGNPRQMVEDLMRSGKMSQSQFNEYAQIANQIIGSGAFK